MHTAMSASATHHTGSLKYHKTMAYKKVKLGWMTIKSKDLVNLIITSMARASRNTRNPLN